MIKVRKRNGNIVDFNTDKIVNAVNKALRAAKIDDKKIGKDVALSIYQSIDKEQVSIEEIHSMVETELMEKGFGEAAKQYILYRYKKKEKLIRERQEKKKLLNIDGQLDPISEKFSLNALRVLESRYLIKDENLKVIETPTQLFERIAVHVGCANIMYDERVFDKDKKDNITDIESDNCKEDYGSIGYDFVPRDPNEYETLNIHIGKYKLNKYNIKQLESLYIKLYDEFKMKVKFDEILDMIERGEFDKYDKIIKSYFDIMTSQKFMPNTPTIANAGNKLGQLSACFTLDMEDNLESIMETAKHMAIIFKSGGGVGINYGKLREEGAIISSTSGTSSGPISFMNIINTITDTVKQGGKRRGANMSILNCISGDSLISTLEGKIKIKDLVGTQPLLYCLNDNKEIRIRKAEKVIHSGKRKLVKIRFDDDTILECTEDHKIMLSNGLYKEASKLQRFDSVMAFYKSILNERYYVGVTGYNNSVPEHVLVGEYKTGLLIKQNEQLRNKDDLCIHHIDNNPLNNLPENLDIITISDHGKIHSDLLQDHRVRIAIERKGKTYEEVYGKEKSDLWKNNLSKSRKGKTPWNKDMNNEEYKEHYKNGFKNQFSNHKVVSVEYLEGENDVYDIVMKDYHNFVANGIFIHNCNNPDILKFIHAKETPGVLENFNVSVGIDDKFWECFRENKPYELISPNTLKVKSCINPRDMFKNIAQSAWNSSEPGVIFFDNANRHNVMKPLKGNLNVTNPCGEQFLYPYESCNLGSINLTKFIKNGLFDWEEFGKAVELTVDFLDNVIDMNKYPIPQIDYESWKTRRIGLGIMGLADLLYILEIPYNSEESYKLQEQIAQFLTYKSLERSIKLSKLRGSFPYFNKTLCKEGLLDVAGLYEGSITDVVKLDWNKLIQDVIGFGLRNVNVDMQAPTGSISMIADCSSGIEPVFALAFEKKVAIGDFYYINQYLESYLKKHNIEYDEDIIKQISKSGSCQNVNLPDEVKRIFVTSMDIHGIDHVLAQAVWQRWMTNSISKTINLPNNATVEDIQNAYLFAHEMSCKGTTIYRDGSRETQVLYTENMENRQVKISDYAKKIYDEKMLKFNSPIEKEQATPPVVKNEILIAEGSRFKTVDIENCPKCGLKLKRYDGCKICSDPECGTSMC